jgi:TolB-like protein/Tfp pilus assembly protein PilF
MYTFGPSVLDIRRRELRRDGVVNAIEPQIFDLLHYLILNRDRVITRDELIAAVWKGRVVSDSTVSSRISTVRAAIGDDGKHQRLVKTFARKGVRFVADVRETRGTAGRPVSPSITALGSKPVIAVLPFKNLSGKPALASLATGITEEIITELCRASDFFVVPEDQRVDLCSEPGRHGVSYLLKGGVSTAGMQVRVTARLVDEASGAYRWAGRYETRLNQNFSLQREIARAIIAPLTGIVERLEAEKTSLKAPETWHAHDYYLRAVATFSIFWSSFEAGDLSVVQRLLAQSIALDPKHARAHALLADTYLISYQLPYNNHYIQPGALDLAHQSVGRALQFDGHLPLAHAMAGRVYGFKRLYGESLDAFGRAQELNPQSADWRHATALIMAGQHARAVQVARTHIRNDPSHSAQTPMWLGVAHFMQGQYADAIPCLRTATLRAPNSRGAHTWLAAALAQLGDRDAARREINASLSIDPTFSLDHQKQLAAVCKNDSDIDHHLDALHKAGLPDK